MQPTTQGPDHAPSEATRARVDDLVRREALTMVFQPIVDLRSGEIAGYEALARPDGSTGFTGASEMFGAAERCGGFEAVEAVARRHALAALARRGDSTVLFINNSPAVFTRRGFEEMLLAEMEAAGGIDPHRLVLEITERTAHGFMEGLSHRSLVMRERGFSVALDDVGAGISGLNQIMSLRPNWIKLDLELISFIDLDPLKQNLIRSFIHFAKLGNMSVVAEGIERDEELRVLIELGVSHGQGFYLAPPGELGGPLLCGMKNRIIELHRQMEVRKLHDPGMVRVSAVATPLTICDASERISEVNRRLAAMLPRSGMAVIDGKRYVGWVSGQRLTAAADGAEAFKAIGSIAIRDTPLVGADWTLAEAMEIAASRSDDQLAVPLIVQTNGVVTGMVSLRNLLVAAADAHRRATTHVAPLTGLPSRVQADRWLASHIRASDPSDIAFIDLRDFDAYNLAYGFEKGDEMLIGLVGLIRARLVDAEEGASFFAHLGEDRFMLALPADARERLLKLMMDFEGLHAELFSRIDVAAGAFACQDSAGTKKTYPLTTLRIVYLPKALQFVHDARELYDLAGRLRLRSSGAPEGRREIIVNQRGSLAQQRASA